MTSCRLLKTYERKFKILGSDIDNNNNSGLSKLSKTYEGELEITRKIMTIMTKHKLSKLSKII